VSYCVEFYKLVSTWEMTNRLSLSVVKTHTHTQQRLTTEDPTTVVVTPSRRIRGAMSLP